MQNQCSQRRQVRNSAAGQALPKRCRLATGTPIRRINSRNPGSCSHRSIDSPREQSPRPIAEPTRYPRPRDARTFLRFGPEPRRSKRTGPRPGCPHRAAPALGPPHKAAQKIKARAKHVLVRSGQLRQSTSAFFGHSRSLVTPLRVEDQPGVGAIPAKRPSRRGSLHDRPTTRVDTLSGRGSAPSTGPMKVSPEAGVGWGPIRLEEGRFDDGVREDGVFEEDLELARRFPDPAVFPTRRRRSKGESCSSRVHPVRRRLAKLALDCALLRARRVPAFRTADSSGAFPN